MTAAEQNKRLAFLVAEFLQHQIKATAALQEINAIGLLENEGNPLTSPIVGEDQLRALARQGGAHIKPGVFEDVVEEAKKTLDANGYIV